MKAKDIFKAIEQVAPIQLQEEYDNAGLQCGNPEREVSRVLCCLDVTDDVVRLAIEQGAEMIVSHHPLLFNGVKCISAEGDYISRALYLALTNDIVIYAAHTNLDNAPAGVNKMIADRLGLIEQEPLASLPALRFMNMDPVFAARCGSGMIGLLPEEMPVEAFVSLVQQKLSADSIRLNQKYDGCTKTTIRKVALCGGAGSDFITAAEKKGADAYVTGEIGYHRMFGHKDILLVEAGHYETEHEVVNLLKDIISPCGVEVTTI